MYATTCATSRAIEKMNKSRLILFAALILLVSLACGLNLSQTAFVVQNNLPAPTSTFFAPKPATATAAVAPLVALPTTALPSPLPPTQQVPTAQFYPTETATPPVVRLDPDDWQNWPVIPNVSPSVREIYQKGQALGNNPRAFSIFGDCQSRPAEFLGIYETDLPTFTDLPFELRIAIEYFRGSLNRESPTAQDGTTPGSLLWAQWHRGQYGCDYTETPVACELRQHRPSFVIIQVGTHFESRNTEYLRRVVQQLIDNGVVPILATKADNREKDYRINRDMALLAAEFDLPLWNFWGALGDLPNRGLYTRPDRPLQGDIYLTEAAQEIHRRTALEALNVVWRAAQGQ
jgi:hypothetical protein